LFEEREVLSFFPLISLSLFLISPPTLAFFCLFVRVAWPRALSVNNENEEKKISREWRGRERRKRETNESESVSHFFFSSSFHSFSLFVILLILFSPRRSVSFIL